MKTSSILAVIFATGYTLTLVEQANDSFGWFYIDVAAPRNQKQYEHLVGQYNEFNREPWRRIPRVRAARTRAKGALAFYHFEKLPNALRTELLLDTESQSSWDAAESRVANCIAYKLAQNGLSGSTTQAVKDGERSWSTIHELYGGIKPPPVRELSR